MSTVTAATTTSTPQTSPRSHRRIGIAAAATALLAAGVLGHPLESGHSRQAPAQRASLVRDGAVRAARLQSGTDTPTAPTGRQEALSQAAAARLVRLQGQADARQASLQAAKAAAVAARQDHLLGNDNR